MKIIMKKISILAFAFGIISLSANSQNLTSKKGEPYLPQAGDWSIGFNTDGIFEWLGNSFNGTSGNNAPSVDFNNGFGSFVGKRFTSATTATRYIANLSAVSNKNGDNSNSQFGLTVGYGKEWRRGATRLQGFYGADALIGVGSNSWKQVSPGNTTEYKSGMGIQVGGQGFIGAEYFIFPKISVGAQYQYAVYVSSSPKSKTTYTDGTPTLEGTANSQFGLSGVGVANMTVNLHF